MGVVSVVSAAAHAFEVGVVLLWPLSVAWVAVDSGRRLRHRGQRRLALGAAALLPFAGALAYRALRPPDYLDERRLRDLERRVLDARLGGTSRCPSCREPVAADHLACGHCGARVRHPCEGCGRALDLLWARCPWCETDVAAPEAQAGRTAPSRVAAGSQPAGA